MKKVSILGMAALMAVAVSCKKNTTDEVLPAEGEFRAVTETHSDNSKTHFGEQQGDGSIPVLWSANDQIRVFNANNEGANFTLDGTGGQSSATFKKDEGQDFDFSSPYYAFYPASTDGNPVSPAADKADDEDMLYTIVLPSTQNHKDGGGFSDNVNPMAAYAGNDRNLSFKNLCGIVRIQLRGNAIVQSIKLTKNEGEALSGSATVVFTGENITNFKMNETSNGGSVELLCNGVQLTKDPKNFDIVVPPTTFDANVDVTVTYKSSKGIAVTKTETIDKDGGSAFARATILQMQPLDLRVGFFASEDDYNNFVSYEFAPGNLWCNTTTTPFTWAFENEQWESCYVGEEPNQPYNSSHVSHFYWTSDPEKAPLNSYPGHPNVEDIFFANNLTISGQEINYWRAPTKEELQYVVFDRPVRYHSHCKVRLSDKGINGVLLFPYEWTPAAAGLSDTEIPANNTLDEVGGFSNVYSMSSDKLSNKFAGCVFFPASGDRQGNKIPATFFSCYYISTTLSTENFGVGLWRFRCGGKDTNIYFDVSPVGDFGCARSVRMVHRDGE